MNGTDVAPAAAPGRAEPVAGPRAPLVQVDGVSARYGTRLAVAEVSLDVAAGEIVALVGPSGSGKSTLLRLIAGLERPAGGTVVLDGQAVAGPGIFVEPEARRVGMVFQDYALFPHLTIARNVAFGLRDRPRAEARRAVGELLAQLGLEAHAERYPHMLSGGERQRAALARALAPRPRVLLMDEPFSSLDERLRDQVRADTTRFLRDTRTTTIVVTHDPGEAMRIADRVALLCDGRLVQSGTPAEMYADPRSHFAAAFFSELNEIPGVCRSGRVDTPLGAFAAADVAPGGAARVCVRPEHVRVSAQPTPVAGDVTHVTFLGDHEEVDVHVPGLAAPLHLHVPSGHRLARGQRIYLDIDPARILVFASATH